MRPNLASVGADLVPQLAHAECVQPAFDVRSVERIGLRLHDSAHIAELSLARAELRPFELRQNRIFSRRYEDRYTQQRNWCAALELGAAEWTILHENQISLPRGR